MSNNLPKILKRVGILLGISYIVLFGLFIKYSLPLVGVSAIDVFSTFNSNLFNSPVDFIKVITPGTVYNREATEQRQNSGTVSNIADFGTIEDANLEVGHPISYFNEFLERSKTEYAASYNWNWEDSLVFGTFLSADREKQLIGLQIISPKDYGVIVENAKLSFNLSCEPAQTFLIDGDLNVLDTEKNVYDLIQEGDSLLSLCTDEACGTLGKACIIWRNGGL